MSCYYAWAVARKRIDHANALPHVVLVIVVLLVELRRLLKCRCRSVDDEDDNDTTYFRAIRTATLERRLAEKTLKPRILNEYRNELRRRKHQPVSEEPQFQTLESYDLRACPVYAGEFALDSRAVRRVDHRRSVGGERRFCHFVPDVVRRGRDSLSRRSTRRRRVRRLVRTRTRFMSRRRARRRPPPPLAHAGAGRRPRATLGPHNELEWHGRARDDRRRSHGASERPSWDVGCRTSRCARRRGRRPPNPSPPSRMRNRWLARGRGRGPSGGPGGASATPTTDLAVVEAGARSELTVTDACVT